jgi:choline dehydrogenase-like flavoprotein
LFKHYAFTLMTCFLRPQSRGSVKLASGDPLQRPLIDANYLATPRDMDALLRGLKLAREVLQQPALAPHRLRELEPGAAVQSDEQIREFIRSRAETVYHPVGTCKMGRDSMAVVDPRLRVHGLDGLRVVDASVMPTLIGGNTNAPTTMIAERAADLILQDAALGTGAQSYLGSPAVFDAVAEK